MSHLPSSTGGTAVPFYASIICRITKSDDIKDSNGVIGIEMRVRNMKNKCSIPFRDANMHLYFNGGFDSNSEYFYFENKIRILLIYPNLILANQNLLCNPP